MAIDKLNDDPIIVALPSDHKIVPKSDFIAKLKQAISLSGEKKVIVSLGIKPTYPATGYGYIKIADSLPAGKAGVQRFDKLTVPRTVPSAVEGRLAFRKDTFFKVEKFTEKPSLPLAKKFIKAKSYFWNSGIFIFPASVMIGEIKRYQPKLYNALLRIEKKPSKRKTAKIYSGLDNISIDYALMEKTKRLYLFEANFKWDDVGSWISLGKYLRPDTHHNFISAFYQGIDTKDCLIISQLDHLIAGIGLKDMFIVQTKDATLICPKDRVEDIKKLVKSLSSLRQFKKYI
jgi:mannose-1-phosphate guanylyltransferase